MIEFFSGLFIGYAIGFVLCGLLLKAKRGYQPTRSAQVEKLSAPPSGGTGESSHQKRYHIFVGEC